MRKTLKSLLMMAVMILCLVPAMPVHADASDDAAVATLTGTKASSYNEWYIGDATLKAPDGYQISIDGETFAASYKFNRSCNGEETYYLKNTSTGNVVQKSIVVKNDWETPYITKTTTADVTDTSAVVTLIGSDKTSGIAYYTVTRSMGTTQPVTITDKGEGVFELTGMIPNTRYSFTTYIYDNSGRSSSDGFVVTTLKGNIENATVSAENVTLKTSLDAVCETAVTVTYNGTDLVKDTDYTVSYENNSGAGTATVTVTGMGDYEGSKSTTFEIQYLETDAEAELSGTKAYYENEWYVGDAELTAPEGYTISQDGEIYSSSFAFNRSCNGEEVYYLKDAATEEIARKTIVVKNDWETPYITDTQTTDITDTSAVVTLIGSDKTSGVSYYTVTRSMGTTQPVTITDKGEGVFELTGMLPNTRYSFTTNIYDNSGRSSSDGFVITTLKGSIENATVLAENVTLKTSLDAVCETAVTVTYNGTDLAKDTDYTVSYENNSGVGTAIVTVTGMGDYEGSTSTTFEIQYLETDAEAVISGTKASDDNEWYMGTVTLVAPEGYEISETGEIFSSSFQINRSCTGDESYYLKDAATGGIALKSIFIKSDYESPNVTKVEATNVTDTSATITITGNDKTSGITKYQLLRSSTCSAAATITDKGNGVFVVTGMTPETNYIFDGWIYDHSGYGAYRSMSFTTAKADIPATKVNVNKTSVSLNKGATITLTATLTPGNSTDSITWSSSDTRVAKVSNDGKVTAVGKGTATITATATSGQKVTCKVTVKVPATKIALNKTSVTINKGKTYTLTATLTPGNSTDSITWSSSNTQVAKVSNDGKVTAVGKGTATITATTTSGQTVTCKVTVKVPATKIKLNKTSVTINKGKTYTLKATLTPSNSTDSIKWTCSNTEVAKVSEDGTITAVGKGTATITATTTSGQTVTCKVTVKVPATKIKLNKKTITLDKGETFSLKATLTPSNSTDSIKWSSSNTKVVKVYSSGKVRALGRGTATITAKTTSGKTVTCKVTVKVPATKIKLNKKTITLDKGDTYTLKATLTPGNSTDSVKWSSSDTGVVKVYSSGKVKAVGQGTATITAKTTSGKTVKCKVTVE